MKRGAPSASPGEMGNAAAGAARSQAPSPARSPRAGFPAQAGPPATPGSASSSTAGEPPTGPQAAAQGGEQALSLLLHIEAMAREAKDLAELRHLAANETRKLNRARQIFVLEIDRAGAPHLAAISGVGVVDQRALLATAVRDLVTGFAKQHGLVSAVEFTLPAYCEPNSDLATAYPFREIAWVPFLDRKGRPFAGLLMARETVWTREDRAISCRLGTAYAHAWRELATAASFNRQSKVRFSWRIAALAVAFLLALPVPMTALAPVEIVAREPVIVAAPLDGVIETIEPGPSEPVKAGDVLVRFSDTQLKNRLAVAAREVGVAEARTRQAVLKAMSDVEGRHELGLAEAELALKRAEFDYARDLFERSVIRATRDGIAVYADRRALTGKPVATGERIMEIADPALIEARIDLAVPDAMALKPDSRVKLFLDVDPLQPKQGQVVYADYRARPAEGDVLAFRTIARLDSDGRPPPRIGLRGTAQVYGDRVPLAVFLFRRPISAARQWLGL